MKLPPLGAQVVYAKMRWNAPLSEAHAALLLQRLDVRAGDQVLDLGCGWGELLLRAVEPVSGATGVGIDTDEWALEHGRILAGERDLSARVTFLRGDVTGWEGRADRVICVGASHALGGTEAAFRHLAEVVAPGGRLLFGDGCWEHPPPTEAAAAIFGDEVLGLGELMSQAVESGWRVMHLSTADRLEWDDFESTWRAGRQEWVLTNPDDPRGDEVQALVDRQLRDYIDAYRGVLGFAYLVLARRWSGTI